MVTLYELATESSEYRALPIDALTEDDAQVTVRGVMETLQRHLRINMPISAFLSVRAENVLKRCRIRSLQELSDYPCQFPGAGAKTFGEFRALLMAEHLPIPSLIFEPQYARNQKALA